MKVELTDIERWELLNLLYMSKAGMYNHAKLQGGFEYPITNAITDTLIQKLEREGDEE